MMFISWYDYQDIFPQMASLEYNLVKLDKNHNLVSKTPLVFPPCSQISKEGLGSLDLQS